MSVVAVIVVTETDTPDDSPYTARAFSDPPGWNLGIAEGGNDPGQAAINLIDEMKGHERK